MAKKHKLESSTSIESQDANTTSERTGTARRKRVAGTVRIASQATTTSEPGSEAEEAEPLPQDAPLSTAHDAQRISAPTLPDPEPRSDPLTPDPVEQGDRLTLKIGRREYTVGNVEEASRLYQRLRDESGLGSRRWREGRLSNGWAISYNGRVWGEGSLVCEAVGHDAEWVVPEVPVNDVGVPATPASGRPAMTEPAPTTLADLFAGYMKHLEERGASQGTRTSYRLELDTAGKSLGTDTPVAEITHDRVDTYFKSRLVMKKRNGRLKSPLSIAKTRRVLRQALDWAGVYTADDVVPQAQKSSETPRSHS